MSRIPCKRCAKTFRTESGLRWHLLHIHQYGDVEQLLMEPSPSTLAEVAMIRELALLGYSIGVGVDVPTLEELIKRHFPGYRSRPPPPAKTQDANTRSMGQPRPREKGLYFPGFLPGASLHWDAIGPEAKRGAK